MLFGYNQAGTKEGRASERVNGSTVWFGRLDDWVATIANFLTKKET